MTTSRLDIDMDYKHFSDYEVKKLLLQKMRKYESVHYILGWLEMCYLRLGDAESERYIAIKEINRYDGVTK